MRQILAVISAVLMVAFCLIPMSVAAQREGPMLSMFCSAVRAGVAQGPQSGSCPLSGLGQNLQNQQTANGVNQNPCTTGYILQGTQCIPINGANNNPFASTANTNTNPTVQTCTPVTTTLTQPVAVTAANIFAVRGTVVTLDGSGSTPGSTQTVCPSGLVGSATTTATNTIVSYAWVQTSGVPVTLVSSSTSRPSFTAPNSNSTTLVFSLTVQDSGALVSSPSTVSVSVR